MRAEDLKRWLAEARRGEKVRETATKDGGGGGERECQTEAEGHWGRVVELIHTAFGTESWHRRPPGRRGSSSRKGRGTTGASA